VHWIDWLYGALCLLLLFVAARWLRGVLATPRLPGARADGSPRVSIVVAARDEADHIETAATSLLEQTGVDLEVVIVDDRSTDGTGAILDRLAAAHDRLRVVHVEALPEGWLGKCHALARGAASSSGGWLLFADADVHMAPDVVSRAVAACERRSADHLALIPRIAPTTLAVRPCLALAALGVYERAPSVNREPPGRAWVGVGAFNLVRRDRYEAFGGHEALRLEVIDDLKLGLLVRRSGGRTLLYDATADMHVPYVTSVPHLFRVVEKNLFALFRFSLVLSLGASGVLIAIWLGALAGPVVAQATGTVVGWAAPPCLWGTAIPATMASRRQGWSVSWGLLSPLALPLAAAATVNSALRNAWRGAIVWRGTRYRLRELRREAVR